MKKVKITEVRTNGGYGVNDEEPRLFVFFDYKIRDEAGYGQLCRRAAHIAEDSAARMPDGIVWNRYRVHIVSKTSSSLDTDSCMFIEVRYLRDNDLSGPGALLVRVQAIAEDFEYIISVLPSLDAQAKAWADSRGLAFEPDPWRGGEYAVWPHDAVEAKVLISIATRDRPLSFVVDSDAIEAALRSRVAWAKQKEEDSATRKAEIASARKSARQQAAKSAVRTKQLNAQFKEFDEQVKAKVAVARRAAGRADEGQV